MSCTQIPSARPAASARSNAPSRPVTALSALTLAIAATGMMLPGASLAKTVSLSSPDKQIVVSLSDDSQTPEYSVSFHGKKVIAPSKLGLVFESLGEFGNDFAIKDIKRSQTDERWQQPWGEREWVTDKHNGLSATLSNGQYSLTS